MKKRLIPLLLALLLLAGCAKTVTVTVPSKQDEPEEKPAESAGIEFDTKSDVFADWSKLSPLESFESVGTRLSEKKLETLKPSGDYGMLVPFVGGYLTDKDWGYSIGSLYGLSTLDGCVVLDPVCSEISRVSYSGQDYTDVTELGMYALALGPKSEDVEGLSEEEQWSLSERYAVAALDGSWVTGFDYTSVYGTPIGALCIIDANKNEAVIINDAGETVLDSRELPFYADIAEYSAWDLSTWSEGWCRITLSGGIIFFDLDGNVITDGDAYFDYVGPFSEGLAAVRPLGSDLYGYINTSGEWVVPPQYYYAGQFSEGTAVVQPDQNNGQIIDTEGNVLKSFSRTIPWQMYCGGELFFCYYEAGSDTAQYLTADGEPLDETLNWQQSSAIWAQDGEGVRIRCAGRELYTEEVESVGYNGTGEYFTALLKNGQYAAMDMDGNILLSAKGDISFLTDVLTGEIYITAVTAGNYSNVTVYSLSGEKLTTGCTNWAPYGGLFPCKDAVSVGLKDTDNNWVLRLKCDSE